MRLTLAKSWLVPLAMALVVCDGCPHPWHSHGGLPGSPDPGCRVKRSDETPQTNREGQLGPEGSPDPDAATPLESTTATLDLGQPQAVEEYVAASEAEDTRANSSADAEPVGMTSASSEDMETQASVDDAISRSFLLPFHLPLQHPPRPPPRRPPHRPPPLPPPPHHPPTRHPPVPDLGPPQELPRPEFDFDFDPPNFFQTSGFPSAEEHFGPPYMDDEEEFFEPHPQDDGHPPFPSHPPEHAPPYLPPEPFHVEDSPPYEHHPPEAPRPGADLFHLPPNINLIMEDSIYRKDVPMKDVQNDRDKVHANLAPAGIKGLDPELLAFIKQHTESYKNAAGSADAL